MNHLKDSDLVRLARTGDKQAMNHLLQRHEPVALSVVTRLIGQRQMASDLVQDAMLEAWLALYNLRDASKFRAWFCGIALNMARSHLRRQRTAHTSLESMLGGVSGAAIASSATTDPILTVEQNELEQTVSEAMNKLSEDDKATLRLYYFEHLSVQEVAAVLGISESAVKSRLFKARRRLRVSLATA